MPKRVSVSDSTSKTKEVLYQRQKLQAFYYNKDAGPTLQPFRPAQPINIMTTTPRDGNKGQSSELGKNQDPSLLRTIEPKASTVALDHSRSPDLW